ncbi:MAG: recombinase family protein, partial [Peptoniphilaceae bacterium]|nr:recombinase family protein [Peptoniphilaceae bacterium]MDD7383226.1 DUF6037 family protein [Peptoniphilaceae bacterium]
MNSLIAQISALTRLTSYYPNWKLVDIYTDIASGKTGSSRKEFSRMLEDIKKEDLNIIVTKSVSRFGRDTVDALEALKVIRQANSRIIFEQENLDSQEDDADLIISIMESLAQSENEQRSENIKWGLKQRAVQGTSKLYNRKCYGYDHDENGELIINFQQAKIVKKIFNWYLEEKSVIGIVKELEKENIKSPKGKNKWPKRSIETMLENEKYTGSVKLLDSINKENYYLLKDNHEAIITEEVFDKVQKEKSSRSNLDEDNVRKSRKYSSRLKEDNKMFKFTALESLHNNMKLNDMERVVFPFRYNEKGFSCIFITDILPYRLYLSTLGDKPITFELKINNKYDTSSYMNDYSKLIEYLELKYDPNHKFKPNDFFRSLNNNIPENCNNTPNYKDVIVIAA